MSKNVAMFIDVANLYYAARGQEVDVDYVALLKHATKGRDLIRAYAYSGLDPENENQRKFIDFLGKNGYKVVHKDIRKFGDGRVKANLDIELVVDLFRLADRMDIAVIVSGDGDFAPAIKALQDQGIRCEVISFKPNTSSDLIAVADEFFDIMKIAGIGRKKEGREAGMSAPEMPAKEVVPEFGFREASPSVAAAALAALKSPNGPKANGRSRRGRRPAGAEDKAAVEVPTLEVAASPESGDATRRRRRRRGGRGRGRSRRAAEVVAPTAGGGDGASEEVDDLSQLEGLGEEREYTFQEADEETLRELGVLDGRAPSGAGADAEPAAAAPSRRPGSRTARAAADETHAAEEGAADKPPRRRAGRGAAAQASAETQGTRSRRRTTRSEPEESPAAATEAPKRRSRAARATASDDAGAGETEPQGIWGRFRSGRTPRKS